MITWIQVNTVLIFVLIHHSNVIDKKNASTLAEEVNFPLLVVL